MRADRESEMESASKNAKKKKREQTHRRNIQRLNTRQRHSEDQELNNQEENAGEKRQMHSLVFPQRRSNEQMMLCSALLCSTSAFLSSSPLFSPLLLLFPAFFHEWSISMNEPRQKRGSKAGGGACNSHTKRRFSLPW